MGDLCVAADLNVLSLNDLTLRADESPRVEYNLCRNLEWVDCAARKLLPGMTGGSSIVFATAPADAMAAAASRLDRCTGWASPNPAHSPDDPDYHWGYTTDDSERPTDLSSHDARGVA
jgi:hypothetical protein